MIFVGCCFQVIDVNAHIPALCAVTVHAREQHPEWAFTDEALVSDSPHLCMRIQITCASSCICVMMSVVMIYIYATAGQYGKGDLEVKGVLPQTL